MLLADVDLLVGQDPAEAVFGGEGLVEEDHAEEGEWRGAGIDRDELEPAEAPDAVPPDEEAQPGQVEAQAAEEESNPG